MNNIILTQDKNTATELLAKGCKLLSCANEIYTLVDCSKKINFADYQDRIVLTNRLKF